MPEIPNTAAIADTLRDPKGLFALFAVVALVLYGISVGRTKALVSLLSIYVAYMLAVLFPFLPWLTERLPSSIQPLLSAGVFIALYALTFAVLSSSLTRTRLSLGEISVWRVAIVSIIQVGLLASICASLMPADIKQQFLGPLEMLIGSRYALWAWAASSLAIMPFMRGHRRDR